MTAAPLSHERDRPSPTACLILIACFLLATALVGWWGVPIVAFVWAQWAARHRPWPRAIAPVAAGSAIVAWGTVLVWTAVRGPLAQLAETLGMLARIPGAALIVLTLVFGALLAWSAAALVDAPVGRLPPERSER
jgi:hypothetical protein